MRVLWAALLRRSWLGCAVAVCSSGCDTGPPPTARLRHVRRVEVSVVEEIGETVPGAADGFCPSMNEGQMLFVQDAMVAGAVRGPQCCASNACLPRARPRSCPRTGGPAPGGARTTWRTRRVLMVTDEWVSPQWSDGTDRP